MGFIILLIPVIVIIIMIFAIISLHQKIDQLEQRIAEGYSPILGDIHRRLEILEQERRS